MFCLLFCDVDENGKIIESVFGERIIPMKQYQHFFFIQGKSYETVILELPNYVVTGGQLVLTV